MYKRDSRYPKKLPTGTLFYPFAKPGVIKEGMTDWEINKQNIKTERAKRWLHMLVVEKTFILCDNK